MKNPCASEVMWVEKYRPATFDELISGDSNNIKTLKKLINSNNLPNLLFYGPPGSGKTSAALIISKILNGKNSAHLTLELNASDSRGIDTVRNEIKGFTSTGSIFTSKRSEIKLVILDEADAMTSTAQFALRRVIENHPRNSRFIFICNHVTKIIPAIQSRCTRIRFGFVGSEAAVKRLKSIAEAEKIRFEEGGLAAAVRLAQGDMRNAINLLQATAFGFSEVTENTVYKCTAAPLEKDCENLFQVLMSEDFAFALEAMRKFLGDQGTSLRELLPILLDFVLRCELNSKSKAFLLESMGEMESCLRKGSSILLQRGALVSAFVMARNGNK